MLNNMWDVIDSSLYRSRLFHPRQVIKVTPSGARDFDIPVEEGIFLGARWYIKKEQQPTVLFFHGNGETVPDYDNIAPLYHQIGLNLFVVDYRGYGWSSGEPSFRTLLPDSEKVLEFFLGLLKDGPRPIIMGRSLGSAPATQLAATFPEKFRFLILESAFGDVVPLFQLFGLEASKFKEEIESTLSNRTHLAKVSVPVLFIHGELDEFFSLTTLHNNLEAILHNRKKSVILKGAGHNNLLLQSNKYFYSIREFIDEY